MAQLERNVKSPSGGTRDQVTVEYLLNAYDTHGQARESPTKGKNHDQEEDRDDHQTKKSVLAKVKEKAKKLKQSLSMKRHNQDDDNATPACDANADGDDYHTEEEEQEEDPEYYGAPMYESELAPEDVKEAARQNPREDVEILEKHVLVGKGSKSTTEEEEDGQDGNPKEQAVMSRTITESVTEKLAPAYAMATEATQMITSKIQDMAIATSLVLERKGSMEQKWDKGVSVKEYLMQKLEPGEEERALSQVISEAMSPRKDPGDKGVVEKVRGTVSSLFGKEESSNSLPSSSSSSSSSSLTTTTAAASSSAAASRASNIPISWNAYQEVEENNEGRVLQAN